MGKENNNKTWIIVLLAVGALCVFCIGVLLVMGLLLFVNTTTKSVITEQENQENVPEFDLPALDQPAEDLLAMDLQGIWQQNRSMAAGWADRYHFYPSGTFHYYPNEMTCSEEKIQKMGTWMLEGSVLTLKTTKQIIRNFEVSTGGFCIAAGEAEELLAEPLIEQFTVVDYGTQEGDIYPSISINDLQFWKFSADASIYGDEEFPE